MIEIQNLSMSYYQGETAIPVLRNLNLQVKKGESVAILGPSGSGKSTLLSLLAGLDQPQAGDIQMDGKNFSTLGEEGLTLFRGQKIGIVFQQYHLIPHLTALENAMLPLEIHGQSDFDKNKTAALESLRSVGLEHRVTHFPHQLSGGENQRVAIARAMIHRPQVLLADEPSGNLDSSTGDHVLELLFKLIHQHQMTSLFVTHSEKLAGRCDRRLTLKDGMLV